MDPNPFAPPSASSDVPPDRGLVFSSEGVAVVASLAAWMRGMSVIFYVGMALLVLGGFLTCGAGMSGSFAGPAMIIAIVMFVLIAGLGAAASWLRSAASGFERGVLSDDEFTVGQGFRSLRAYLILFGIIGIVGLISQIHTAIKFL